MINRRKLIGAATLLGVSASTIVRSPIGHTKARGHLDFSTPKDNLFGLMKLMGNIAGSRTYYYQPGRVFVHRDGSLPHHIMNYTGATVREIRKIDEVRYLSRYSGWQLFRDPVTNAVIDEWTNPLTAETHAVKHFVFPKSRQSFSATGLKRPDNYKGDFSWFDRPFILPWQTLGDDVWAPYEQFSRYTNREGHARYENAIHTYKGSLADLENGNLTSAPSSIASQSQSPYYHWMGYGDELGHLISTSLGKKSDNMSLFPTEFLGEMNARYPDAFDVSFDWGGLE